MWKNPDNIFYKFGTLDLDMGGSIIGIPIVVVGVLSVVLSSVVGLGLLAGSVYYWHLTLLLTGVLLALSFIAQTSYEKYSKYVFGMYDHTISYTILGLFGMVWFVYSLFVFTVYSFVLSGVFGSFVLLVVLIPIIVCFIAYKHKKKIKGVR